MRIGLDRLGLRLRTLGAVGLFAVLPSFAVSYGVWWFSSIPHFGFVPLVGGPIVAVIAFILWGLSVGLVPVGRAREYPSESKKWIKPFLNMLGLNL
ncbi:MAG: hypothetical protein HY399_08920 [Elusimicrobia bacterium]|nr:hypothetical protein [Elusimicrobiota bacterium]